MNIALAAHQRIREVSAKSKKSATALATIQVLDKLASEPGCRVLRWIEKNYRQLKASSVDRAPVDEAWAFSEWVALRQPLTPWERLDAKTRKRRLERIDGLASDLAKLLLKADSPPAPVAVDLFQADRLPLYGSRPSLGHADVLRLREQKLAPMLGRLGLIARHELARQQTPAPHDPRRQARPLTGEADKRAFVCEVARWFERRYGAYDAEVIADVINLVAPDAEAPFDGKKVRQCLDAMDAPRSRQKLPKTRGVIQAG